jgi:alkyldihydroxyacetonephosphate synthase
MVVSVTAVLGTGETVVTPERPFVGPDVAQLLLGSEGTLCAFTRARLRVCPMPAGRAFHAYDFKRLEDGVEALRLMFRSGLRPAVARLHDPLETAMMGDGRSDDAGAPSPSAQAALQRDVLPALLRVIAPQALGRAGLLNQAAGLLRKSRLLVVFEGDPARVAEEDAAARLLCGGLGAIDAGPEPAERWMRARYDAAYRVSKVMEGGAFADTFDVAAPWDKVLGIYERVREAAAPHAFVLGQLPHAYAEGCALSFSFIAAAASDRDERERYESLWRVVLSAALSAGGNVSHHQGIGLLRARALQDALGDGRHALRSLKTAFDPDGIMNPGKLGL